MSKKDWKQWISDEYAAIGIDGVEVIECESLCPENCETEHAHKRRCDLRHLHLDHSEQVGKLAEGGSGFVRLTDGTFREFMIGHEQDEEAALRFADLGKV
jgi:hypothetical protein